MLIYILEDDDNIREIESYALKNSGYEVNGFDLPSKFYTAMEYKLPDLIILDIMLPEEDGLSVLNVLKSNPLYDKIPIIIISAKTTELDRVKGLDLGAEDYMCKPFGVMELVSRVKARLRDKVEEAEQKLDAMEDKLATYLLKLSAESLTEADSSTVSELLHTIGDFERIGDHAINMVKISKEMNDEGVAFSDEAKADFVTLFAALTEISELAVNAYAKNDVNLAVKVEPLEEVIDKLTAKIKHKHIERMQKGLCSPALGVHISNLLIFCERISDHYSNVAVIIIQTTNATLQKHDYLNELRAERTPQFVENYNKYKHKYRLAEQ